MNSGYKLLANRCWITTHRDSLFPTLEKNWIKTPPEQPNTGINFLISAVFRPIYRQFYWILVLDVLMLGYMGAMPAEGIYLVLARVGTLYYFAHFIIVLPVVGLLEKTDPVPMSISEPVLTGGADPALARKDNEKI